MPTTPTVYKWIGGAAAIRRWLDAFYDTVEQDELLAPVFDGRITAEHREGVTAWWSEVMGGPRTYSEEHGGYAHMMSKHRRLGITDEQRLRFVTLLSAAADAAGLPDDPEARSALMAYAEWGTRLALQNSAVGAEPPACARPQVGLGRGAAVPAVARWRFDPSSGP